MKAVGPSSDSDRTGLRFPRVGRTARVAGVKPRRDARWQVFFHLRVFDTGSDQPLGLLLDVSESGVRLGGEHELPVGNSYRVWMEVPFEAGDKARIQFEAEPVWNRRDSDSGLYECGCRIVGLLPRARLVLEDLIGHLERRASSG